MTNIILAGVPRSGTTLCCNLLNKLPNVVAITEPMNHAAPRFRDKRHDHHALAKEMQTYFNMARRRALNDGEIVTKHEGGVVPDNGFGSPSDQGRENTMERGPISITKPLGNDFALIIKEPNFFMSLLPALNEQFSAFAVVRNPVATICSAMSISGNSPHDEPPQVPEDYGEGWMPAHFRYGPGLREYAARATDLLDFRLRVADYTYERIGSSLHAGRIIRYEDLVASGGRELAKIHPAASELNESLSSRNLSDTYNRELMSEVVSRLLSGEFSSFWRFYERSEVASYLD